VKLTGSQIVKKLPAFYGAGVFITVYTIAHLQAGGSCECFVTKPVFMVSWRTTPCRPSATAYSVYSQLPFMSGGPCSIQNPRTRHALVTGTHLSWMGAFTYSEPGVESKLFVSNGGLIERNELVHCDRRGAIVLLKLQRLNCVQTFGFYDSVNTLHRSRQRPSG